MCPTRPAATDPAAPPHASSDLAVKIAWLYHVERMTQEAVAQHLNLSRIKVMRSLASSVAERVIVTTINARSLSQIEMERTLERRWGLTNAVVVPTPADPANLERAIGHAVAAYIEDHVTGSTVLAIGGGATLHASLDFMRARELPEAAVIGLVGGLPHARWINPSIVASRVARRLGAESYQITAPVMVDAPDLCARLWALPSLRDVRERAAAADLAILTVGEMSPDATIFRHGIVAPDLLPSLTEAGAVANVLSYFVDAGGALVDHEVNRRIMAIPPAEVARLPNVVLAAGGPQKVEAILAALKSVKARVLISDSDTAARLLEADD